MSAGALKGERSAFYVRRMIALPNGAATAAKATIKVMNHLVPWA